MAIYYLDADDEVTSAAARIRDSSDDRIGLVLSNGSRIATSRINFRLLAREARHRHKRLAIITADPSVQSVVRSAELPAYISVGEYEKAEAARARGLADGTTTATSDALDELAMTVGPAARAGSGGYGGMRGPTNAGIGRPSRVAGGPIGGGRIGGRISKPAIAGIAAILVLVLAASAVFFYPSATVVVTLREQPLGPIALSVRVDPAISAPNDQSVSVPGVTRAFPVSVSGTFEATGQRIDETAATGTVTFTSEDTGRDWAIPVGTQVSTADGTAFVTTARVIVPNAVFSPPTRGHVDATVTAVKKGVAGNVAAGKIVKMPDISGVGLLKVSNAAPTAGGTHTVTPVIAQADIDSAEKSLYAQMESSFKAKLSASDAAPTGSTLLPASAHLGLATCNPDPAGLIDQEGASFVLACTGSGTATVADMTVVKALGERRVKAAVKTGYILVESSVTADLGTPVAQGEAMVVPVTVRASQVQLVDAEVIRAGVKGKSLDEARAFAGLYGTAEISVSPGWASTMPSFDFRIDVQVVLPPDAAGSSASPGASTRTSRPPGTSNPQPPAGVDSGGPPAASTSPSPAEASSQTSSAAPSASSAPSASVPPAGSPVPTPTTTSTAGPTAGPTATATAGPTI